MKKIFLPLSGIILFAVCALAQNSEPVFSDQTMAFFQKEPADAVVRSLSYNFVYTGTMGGELVKSAPYTATAITESTQVLGDGNRIVNKTTAFQARDSEGRTRREVPAMVHFLPQGKQEQFQKPVMINDPVAKTDYMLNLKDQTARVLKHENGKAIFIEQFGKSEGGEKARMESEQKMKIKLNAATAAAGAMAFRAEPGELKHEDLGSQVIEGVSCTGSREIRTIPAGAIGNERPLEIVSETWKSPDLRLVVLSRHSDPRFGETVYRLSDIKRDEPDPALFQVPSNYKVIESEPPSLKP